ncbi:MAG TPA: hypothetical protein DCW42_09235 [Bacteroidetes bacterium]|nr:hypothetical protein [Bacteroidota bacterium]
MFIYLDVPCVTSFNGGTSWIAEDEETAVFFPPGDAVMCAHQISRIFRDRDLVGRLSANARAEGLKRHNIESITARQYAIYKNCLINSSVIT